MLHDRGIRDAFAIDQRPAAAAGFVDDAATPGPHLVINRVGVDPEGDAGLEIERSGEKRVVRAISLQLDRVALGAAIHCPLNTLCVQPRRHNL